MRCAARPGRAGALASAALAAASLAAAILAAPARGDGPVVATAHLIQVSTDRDTAYIVPVSIGPLRDLLFLIDTAATRTVIAPSVRSALSLPSIEAKTEFVSGAGGDISAQSFILPSLAVAGAVQRDLHVVVLELESTKTWIGRSLDGILGADYLRNYDVRLSGADHRIELIARRGRAALPEEEAGGYTRVPFEFVGGGFLVMPVRINGHEVRGVLDTGSSRSVLNARAAALAGLPPFGDTIEMAGADNVAVRILRQRVRRLEFAGLLSEDESVCVGDLPVFHQFGLDAEPAVILGAGSLQNRSVLISYSAGALFIERHPGDLPFVPMPQGRPARPALG